MRYLSTRVMSEPMFSRNSYSSRKATNAYTININLKRQNEHSEFTFCRMFNITSCRPRLYIYHWSRNQTWTQRIFIEVVQLYLCCHLYRPNGSMHVRKEFLSTWFLTKGDIDKFSSAILRHSTDAGHNIDRNEPFDVTPWLSLTKSKAIQWRDRGTMDAMCIRLARSDLRCT